MKILIFHPSLAPYRIDLFNAIAERHEVRICLFATNSSDNQFDIDMLQSVMRVTPKFLLQRYNLGLCKIPKGIISEIKIFNPDIVILSEYGMKSFLVAIYRYIYHKKFRIIDMVDDSYAMTQGDNHYNKISHKIEETVMLPLIDDLITVEPRVAEYFQRKYHKGQYFPIIADDNRIRNNYLNSLDISKKYITRYNLAGKKIYLYVGRLVALKNIPLVIRAFQKANISDSVLVIVGDGVEKDICQHQADKTKKLNNIIFTGRLEGSALDAWYNIANVHILASWQEAFGAVTNEALLGGCYSLVSDKAGSACLIESGRNGYVFDPYNEEQLKGYMQSIAKNITPCPADPTLRSSRMIESFDTCLKRLLNQLNLA